MTLFDGTERAKLQEAIDAIPAEQEALFTALYYIHRHDWSQLENVIRGYQQMLDVRYEQESAARAIITATLVEHEELVGILDQRVASLELRMHRLEFIEKRAARHQRENEAEDLGQGRPS